MRSLLIPALLVAVLLAQGPKPKVAPKKATEKAVERYDPDKLPPGEIACGREMPRAEDNCRCMEHRAKASQEAQALCEGLAERVDRAKCMVANEACAIVPTDVDSVGYNQETGERMPSQCKRSCRKARCECCKS